MSDEWNLGDGLENVCRSVLRKAHYAAHQTEEKPRTIINLDAYEITALIWAMNEYIDEPNDSEKPNNCETCKNWDSVNDHCYFIQECRYEPKTEPQTESTGSPIGDYRDGVGAWSDCPWK